MSKIIVPTDFSSTSDAAVNYACEISKTLKSPVEVLHIVKDKSGEADALTKLNAQISKHKEKTGIEATPTIRFGSIFEEIPKMTEELNGELIVMGTHGLTGLQYLTGSNALRVISDSDAQFIVVQEKTKHSANIKRILVPLDLHKETKQKIKFASALAQKFNAEVHIICPKETDEFLSNQVKRNMSYAEGYFVEHGVACKTKVTEEGSSGFVKELLKYAQYAEIDLICILNFAGERLIHAFGVAAEQQVITNDAGIPVLVINPISANVDSRSIFAQ
ncbi:MAG: universal stress protein [Flavobacteriales bacterium]|nr:universal stress protein [Flavobacteriales bacterium]MDP4730793.1 universal stress protein [Flavobacteriales bacterium]MDP4951680.1 universal stress protein [Flavobacteriales bacterium]